jgi:predicted DNA-binding transcriptional regulator AlpA
MTVKQRHAESPAPASKTLTNREMWQMLGISQSTFYRLKEQGVFRKLQAPLPNRYSRERVEAWIAGRSMSQMLRAS